jgi:hypothetical protein
VPVDRSPRLVLLLFALAGIALVGTSIGLARLVGERDGVDRVIVIPAGTAERLAAGQDVALIPEDLDFRLRDRLIVINDDVVEHQVGPFTVAPGDRLERRFSEAATFEGFCSLHPGGRITIDIAGT